MHFLILEKGFILINEHVEPQFKSKETLLINDSIDVTCLSGSPLILHPEDPFLHFTRFGGGKATNLFKLHHLIESLKMKAIVPPFFCVSTESMACFIRDNKLESTVKLTPSSLVETEREIYLKAFHANVKKQFMKSHFPLNLLSELKTAIKTTFSSAEKLAIRSSGGDEDSQSHSFAGFISGYFIPLTHRTIRVLHVC